VFFGAANHFSAGFAAGPIAAQAPGVKAGIGLRILESCDGGIALGHLYDDRIVFLRQ